MKVAVLDVWCLKVGVSIVLVVFLAVISHPRGASACFSFTYHLAGCSFVH